MPKFIKKQLDSLPPHERREKLKEAYEEENGHLEKIYNNLPKSQKHDLDKLSQEEKEYQLKKIALQQEE